MYENSHTLSLTILFKDKSIEKSGRFVLKSHVLGITHEKTRSFYPPIASSLKTNGRENLFVRQTAGTPRGQPLEKAICGKKSVEQKTLQARPIKFFKKETV